MCSQDSQQHLRDPVAAPREGSDIDPRWPATADSAVCFERPFVILFRQINLRFLDWEAATPWSAVGTAA
jgi:hypothetical protein